MSRRAQIVMTPEEIKDFLADGKVANIATIGPNGRPHVVPLWYVPRGDGLATWTYASSQKAANLRKLPQATVLIETGESYDQLRGVSMECDVELVEDTEKVALIGTELMRRYNSGETEVATAATQFVRVQAAKRIGLICTPTKVVSWDHRKLGGTY
ncbi:pyridoxamine 5'-phosphate oxidase family protein [Actinophytocola sp.]|jgi:PPOX class probable F420-dependent enzyme|uniref:pyridoxamine 5'-phosphate oxidase family protein n=1 Tax=Actinophytocola sp. TaxID=1872138 RepID=UPI002ED85685